MLPHERFHPSRHEYARGRPRASLYMHWRVARATDTFPAPTSATPRCMTTSITTGLRTWRPWLSRRQRKSEYNHPDTPTLVRILQLPGHTSRHCGGFPSSPLPTFPLWSPRRTHHVADRTVPTHPTHFATCHYVQTDLRMTSELQRPCQRELRCFVHAAGSRSRPRPALPTATQLRRANQAPHDQAVTRHNHVSFVVTYAHYACVADCADAMADVWEDTAGCAQAICLRENLLKCQYIVKWGLHGIVHI